MFFYFTLIISFTSVLSVADEKCFGKEGLDFIFDRTVDFILDIHAKKIEDEFDRMQEGNRTAFADDRNNSQSPLQTQANHPTPTNDFYESLVRKAGKTKDAEVQVVPTVLMARANFKERVVKELQAFQFYCKGMDVKEELRTYCGTELFHNLHQQNKISYGQDPKAYQKLFCLLSWWKIVGAPKFKLLAPAAAIIYGKPSHNAFQERVFSSGTWKDSRLKKRRKEKTFEMEVLESVNLEFTNSTYFQSIIAAGCSVGAGIERTAELETKTKARQTIQNFYKKENKRKNYVQSELLLQQLEENDSASVSDSVSTTPSNFGADLACDNSDTSNISVFTNDIDTSDDESESPIT